VGGVVQNFVAHPPVFCGTCPLTKNCC
jgi:hypothetical protein